MLRRCFIYLRHTFTLTARDAADDYFTMMPMPLDLRYYTLILPPCHFDSA